MSALDAALQQIDQTATLPPPPPPHLPAIDPEAVGEPVGLPDGRTIYVPRLHGRRVQELACALLDLETPARSKFLRLTGPPGTGKSQLARAIALELWRRRGRAVSERHGQPFMASWRSAVARPRTSTCSGTSSCPPPTVPATSA